MAQPMGRVSDELGKTKRVRCKKSDTIGLEGQHTCMLKSPRIKTLSWFDIVSERKSENCKIKFLLLGG